MEIFRQARGEMNLNFFDKTKDYAGFLIEKKTVNDE